MQNTSTGNRNGCHGERQVIGNVVKKTNAPENKEIARKKRPPKIETAVAGEGGGSARNPWTYGRGGFQTRIQDCTRR